MLNVTLFSSKVLLSESESNPDVLIAKFCICDFSTNKNGVALNRDSIDDWVLTLKNKPLVGKISLKSDGEYDFTGHNVKVVNKVDEEGNSYKDIEFDTEAFGTFVDVAIENIDGVDYIVATAEVWKRFTRACEIIKKRAEEGTLHTSWEISVEDETRKMIKGSIVRIINQGRFIGHCLLGKGVTPAYDSSGLLEVASKGEDVELSDALSQDILESLHINSIEKEEKILSKKKIIETSEPNVNNTVHESKNNVDDTSTSKENNLQISALTEWDLRKKIMEACRVKLDKWCWVAFHFPVDKTVWVEVDGRETELDYVLFTYEVENDEVTVSEPENVKLTVSVSEVNSKITELTSEIEAKNDAIVKASEEIQSLKTRISELMPFKDKFEQAEQERVEKELAKKKEDLIAQYTKTRLISKEEFEQAGEIKDYLDNLDEKGLKEIVATRYMESLNDDKKIETSNANSTNANASLIDDEETVDAKAIIKKFINRR